MLCYYSVVIVKISMPYLILDCSMEEISRRTLFCLFQRNKSPAVLYFRIFNETNPWPYLITLYKIIKTENSCGNNCWIQPTNKFNRNKFYRSFLAKYTEQCNFVKCLSILIANKHKNICPFIEKWVDCNCILVYNSLYVLLQYHH